LSKIAHLIDVGGHDAANQTGTFLPDRRLISPKLRLSQDKSKMNDTLIRMAQPREKGEAATLSAAALILERQYESKELDWDHAVGTAAAHLNEGWVLPRTRCFPTGVEEELAAFYFAYGLFDERSI
jgi:hypothetical protein